jgi:hypothetical protein
MVLKAPDYGFIGLKLKGLIFPASGNRGAHGAIEYLSVGRGVCSLKMRLGHSKSK